jgi:hypothetical protein
MRSFQGHVDPVRVHDWVDSRRQQNEGAYNALAYAVIAEWNCLDSTLGYLKHGQR